MPRYTGDLNIPLQYNDQEFGWNAASRPLDKHIRAGIEDKLIDGLNIAVKL